MGKEQHMVGLGGGCGFFAFNVTVGYLEWLMPCVCVVSHCDGTRRLSSGSWVLEIC